MKLHLSDPIRPRCLSTIRALVIAVLCTVLTPAYSPSVATPRPSVIPNLSGFGTKTVAGSGRHLRIPKTRIYRVTNLADRGKGSLRHCAEARIPRTCIFHVGGVINLLREIKITSPYITIAGQTAPAPGITLTNAGIKIASRDVLIQHIAIRPGDDEVGSPPGERDGISIGAKPPKAAYNVVIDHVSLTWAIDENLSTAYPRTRSVTISNSLIAEGLHKSLHPKGAHSKGVMIGDGSKRITLAGNLIAFNEERNPYLKPGTSVEFINNVVYGWGSKGGWSLCNLSNNTDQDEPILLSFVGNIYRPGPSSVRLAPLYAKKLDARSIIYLRDNIGPTESAHSEAARSYALPAQVSPSTSPPISSALSQARPSQENLRHVLITAGARTAQRDKHDRRIVQEVESSTGTLKDCTTGCSHATGKLDLFVNSARPLVLPRLPFKDSNGDGYTNLENWLHKYSAAVEAAAQ